MKHLYSLVILLVMGASFTLSFAQTIAPSNASYPGACDGSITFVDAANYTGFTWSWYENDTSNLIATNVQTVSNLCAGNYLFTLDSAGNTLFVIITVSDPCSNMVVSPQVTNCTPGNCDGVLQINVSGGTAPYTFAVDGAPQSAQSIISNLCPGTHTIECMDALGCMPSATSVTVTDPSAGPIVPNLSTSSSYGGACNGFASVSPTGGSGSYTYLWSTGATTSSISMLCPGNYSVTIYDSTDTTVVNVTILNICNGFTGSVSATQASGPGLCDGSATFFAIGGTAPYTYNWNNGATTQSILNLCSASYICYCTDAMGCTTTVPVTVTVTTVSPLSANLSTTDDYLASCAGSAAVSPSGGTPPYTVIWSDGQTANAASNLCAGIYSVSIWDAVNDSISVDFIIADSSVIYGTNPYPNATPSDTLYTYLVANCVIDYNAIDSASLYQAVYDSISQNLFVTWAVYTPTDTTYLYDTLGFAGNPGYYSLVISVYCPNKSGNDFFQIEQLIYFDGTTVYFSTLGLPENLLDQVRVFPNPFTHVLSIDNHNSSVKSVKLMDLNGRILSERTTMGSGTIKLDQLERISSGTYLLILSGENSSKTFKVMK